VPSETAVLSLLGAYCRAMDGPAVQPLLDCFTPDGSFRYYAVGTDEPMMHHRGTAELRAWFAEHRVANPIGSQTHVTVNPSVTVAEDEASAVSTYLSVRESASGAIVITATGTYTDRIVRVADRDWRFADRICRAFMPRA
jgi:hypothetical protein